MNNIAPKLQKCWAQKIAFKIVPKMLKQSNFIHSQPSTLLKEALAKFYDFWFDFYDKFCGPHPTFDFLRILYNHQKREP